MAIEKILVIGQDQAVRAVLSESSQAEYGFEYAATVAEAKQQVSNGAYDLVVVDTGAPDFDAFSTAVKAADWPITVVVAAPEQRHVAVKAIELGAFTYVLKPVSREEFVAVVARCAEHKRISGLCRWACSVDESLLGDSFASSQLRSVLAKVGQTNIPVLIRGPIGAGKEFIARQVHAQSSRATGPFVKVDCAALSEDTIEQAFFGWSIWDRARHARGTAEGALELAAGGTVLIDEVCLLPTEVQSQLLKAIQEKKFRRTDGSGSIPLDVRIIATSTRDIEKEVEKGKFNEQLFYALNVVPIWVPALKERPQDIRIIASSFARYFGRKYGIATEVPNEAITAFEQNDWSCNVRQLRSAVEQRVVSPQSAIVSNVIIGQSSPTNVSALPGNGPDVECLDEIEKRHILTILARCNGNRTLAAKRLGISIRTIRNKLKLYRSQPNVEVMQQAV